MSSQQNDTSYPTITESAEALAKMWVKWNIHELDANEVMLELNRKGYFLDAISNAWANECDVDANQVKLVWLEDLKRRNLSSPTTVREVEE